MSMLSKFTLFIFFHLFPPKFPQNLDGIPPSIQLFFFCHFGTQSIEKSDAESSQQMWLEAKTIVKMEVESPLVNSVAVKPCRD